METVYVRPELTDEETACLRTAPHSLYAINDVGSGPGYTIAALARMGYLYPAKRYVGRDAWSDATEYDLTPLGLAAIGGVRPSAADNELIGCVFPVPREDQSVPTDQSRPLPTWFGRLPEYVRRMLKP